MNIAATRHMPYGTAAVYAEGIRNANMKRMAKLVKRVGILLQTKVYFVLEKRKMENCGSKLARRIQSDLDKYKHIRPIKKKP